MKMDYIRNSKCITERVCPKFSKFYSELYSFVASFPIWLKFLVWL